MLDGARSPSLPATKQRPPVRLATDVDNLSACAVIVAPAKKWAFVNAADHHCSYGVIDETYQMRSDALMEVADLFGALVAVGDPGQLSPWTSGDETLVRGIDTSPLSSVAHVLLASNPDARIVDLPVSWRLTPAAAEVVSDAFYTTGFRAGSLPGARRLTLSRLGNADGVEAALGHAADTGWALLQLPQAHLPTSDPQAVGTLASLVTRAPGAGGTCRDEDAHIYPLDAPRIAVGVAHRAQRDAVRVALNAALPAIGVPAGAVVVDTANRLQGRQ